MRSYQVPEVLDVDSLLDPLHGSDYIWLYPVILGASGNQPSEALKGTQKTKQSMNTGVYLKFSSHGLHIFGKDRKLTFNLILAWKTLRQPSVKHSVKVCPFGEKTVITFGQNFPIMSPVR